MRGRAGRNNVRRTGPHLKLPGGDQNERGIPREFVNSLPSTAAKAAARPKACRPDPRPRRFLITGLGRLLLLQFALLSRVMTYHLMRQMEFDADRYEAEVAGKCRPVRAPSSV